MSDNAIPPIVFADATGREWFPVFDDDAVADVKSNFGIDLDRDMKRKPGVTAGRLFKTPSVFGTVLLIACRRQAGWDDETATGAAGDAFLKATRTDRATFDRAAEALIYALARRYAGTAHGRLIRQALAAWRRSPGAKLNSW